MLRTKILILESDEQRIEGFRNAIARLSGDFELLCWKDAPGMIAECERFFESACLISLEHDLPPIPGANRGVITGLEVATFLCRYSRVCPVILHSANSERVWAMENELRFAGWLVERVGPLGEDWIEKLWLPKARWLLEKTRDDPVVSDRPPDHAERMGRALRSLSGLSVGNAFGACFGDIVAQPTPAMRQQLDVAAPPPSPWKVTGDSIMAICLVETLDRCGEVNRDLLAQGLGERYLGDPKRGYGRVIRAILRQLSKGVPWPKAAGSAFGGLGSMGNGAAVRAAPVGAYFSDRIDEVIEQARRSAEVTHAHAEAQAGAVAIALAAAWAAAHEGSLTLTSGAELLAFCAEFTPTGATREGLNRTRTLSFGAPVDLAARTLGNGSQLTAPDTVPFALWCAARHLDNCRQALWTAVRGLGDCDTNCAITGGIVVLSAGLASLPGDWLGAREPLPVGSSAIRFSPRV